MNYILLEDTFDNNYDIIVLWERVCAKGCI